MIPKNKIIWLLMMLATSVHALSQDVIAEDREISCALILPKDKEIVIDSNGVLLPSFIVGDFLSRLESTDAFHVIAPTYMNGYTKELAQIITGNFNDNYSLNSVEWFRFGSKDATNYTKAIVDAGGTVDYDLLGKFGYQKVSISGTYNILRQLEYGENSVKIQVYTPKKIQDELQVAILAKKSTGIAVKFTGWLSPLGQYDSESGVLSRMLVVESYQK